MGGEEEAFIGTQLGASTPQWIHRKLRDATVRSYVSVRPCVSKPKGVSAPGLRHAGRPQQSSNSAKQKGFVATARVLKQK